MTTTTTNTSIPITKMVNDLFLQWLSLPDTRTTLSSALHCVRTNSKMPEPIVYSKVYMNFIEKTNKCFLFNSFIQHVAEDFQNLNILNHHLFHLYHVYLQVHVLIHLIIFHLVKVLLV